MEESTGKFKKEIMEEEMKPSEELLLELYRAAIKISQLSEDVGYFSDKQIREQNYAERRQLWQDFDMIQIEITERLDAYDRFHDNILALFDQNAKLTTKLQRYEEFKREFLKLKERIKKEKP